MTAHIPEEKQVSNWPKFTEQHWYTLAISAVIITGILSGFAAAWVLSEPSITKQAKMVAVIAPFGTIPIAIITFCTVAWRGMVGTRQVNEQKRANDSKDEENIAKLMMDGTKLLGEEKEAYRLAGIAALATVAISKHDDFASHCMNMLADQINLSVGDREQANIYRAAKAALENGHAKGRKAKRQIKIDHSKSVKNVEIIVGSESVSYINAQFNKSDMNLINNLSEETNIHMSFTAIIGATIYKKNITYNKCTFENCEVFYTNKRTIEANDYAYCDFTDATLELGNNGHLSLNRLSNHRNWCREYMPPKTMRGGVSVRMRDYFEFRKDEEEDDDSNLD